MPTEFDNYSSYYINPSTADGKDSVLIAPTVQEIRTLLESNDDTKKIKGMKQLLTWLGSGSPETVSTYDRLLMSVIRFVAASKNHRVGKLVQLYWEAMPKVDGEGRGEILLVSQIIRNDLQSPNEYVRGACLRNLAKMCTLQILGTVDECIAENLTHPFAYVRRNAAMCIYALAQKFGPTVVLQGHGELEEMSLREVDVSAQRAAILALNEVKPVRTAELFILDGEQIAHIGDVCQLAVIDLIRNAHRNMYNTFPPTQLAQDLQTILSRDIIKERLTSLLEGTNDAVALEAASTLLWASEFAPKACKDACNALVKILVRQRDINVRLIILDSLNETGRRCPGVCDSYVVDVLRALSSPSLELRQKILDCCLPAISSRTVRDATQVVRTELVATMDVATPQASRVECQKQLVRALRQICTSFPDVTESIIDLLLDFLTENESSAAVEVAMFVREQIVDNVSLRPRIISRLLESLPEMTNAKTLRMSVWLLGEFCDSEAGKCDIVNTIHSALSPFPFPEPDAEGKERDVVAPVSDSVTVRTAVTVRTIVLPDGSYGTENVVEELDDERGENKFTKVSGLRVAVTSKTNTLLTSIIGVALAKLSLKAFSDSDRCPQATRSMVNNKMLLVLSSLIKFSSNSHFFGSTSAVTIRLKQCLKAVLSGIRNGPASTTAEIKTASLKKVIEIEREAAHQEELNVVLSDDESLMKILAGAGANSVSDVPTQSAVDDIINFRIVGDSEEAPSGSAASASTAPIIAQLDFLNSTTLAVQGKKKMGSDLMMALMRPSKAVALSGYADPVYVEGVMQINHLDLIIELLLVNQTNEILQNVVVSMGTHGDLKVLEKPRAVTLEAGSEETVFASIRLSSTEAGVIFGYCSFERKAAKDKEYFNLNELQIDLLDCIQRAWIGNMSFRTMWAEFEWENKISVQLPSDDVFEFLALLLRQTKMTIVGVFGDNAYARKLTQLKNKDKEFDLIGDSEAAATERYIKAVRETPVLQQMAKSRIFAVNLCSKSIFGEDALLNLSLEKCDEPSLTGSVRIRSRTQGIALSLGDRIAQTQRAFASAVMQQNTRR